jgi:thiamine-phosphate diphosphorylase
VTGAAHPVLCLVTSRHAVDPDARTTRDELVALERWLDEALDAVDLIQVRERDLPARQLGAFVTRLVARSRTTFTRILVNDRVDVAVASDADGIHLRGDGPATERVRELLTPGPSGASGLSGPRALGPSGCIVSRSIHTPAEAAAESRVPVESRADVLVFGSVFAPLSKPGPGMVSGVVALADAVRLAAIPVLAIGGVTPSRAEACRIAGAAGIAAITAFLPPGRSPDALGPRAAAAAFRRDWTSSAGPANPQDPVNPQNP